jgi:hypothetical protein
MRIAIHQIADRGVAEQERLHLDVTADTNLSCFVVVDTVRSGSGIAPNPKHVYWFADRSVRAGDSVILYTRPGHDTSVARADGKVNHFFYWNLPQAVWTKPSSCAVLLEVSEWMTSAAVSTPSSLAQTAL